jgi:predicted CopG family antitoxin
VPAQLRTDVWRKLLGLKDEKAAISDKAVKA